MPAKLFVGQRQDVLVEDQHKGKWRGRTRNNKLVFFEPASGDGADLRGQTVSLTITQAGAWSMQGDCSNP